MKEWAWDLADGPHLEVPTCVEEVCKVMVTHADALFDEICFVAAQFTLQPVLCGLCSGINSLNPRPAKLQRASSTPSCSLLLNIV